MFPCTRKFIKNYFKNVVSFYEESYLWGLTYKKYLLSKYEIVYCVEDSFVLFICIEHTKQHGDLYHIKLEELTPNNIFKFIIKDFENCFENAYYLIFYKKFNGLDNYMQKSLINACTLDTVLYINKRIPKLKIYDRAKQCEGTLNHIIYFELRNNDSLTHVITYSDIYNKFKATNLKCKELKNSIIKLLNNLDLYQINNYYFVDNFLFEANIANFLNHIDSVQSSLNMFKFWTQILYIKDYNNIDSILIALLDNFINSKIYTEKPQIYKQIPVKWKSEYALYELLSSIYGEENVIYQFRPFFLQYNGHQLSYDVFIPHQRLAFEYQGKQHFEPIEYFGGKKAFQLQRKRDNIKKELSVQNEITLIYINYFEDLTVGLINQKIKDATPYNLYNGETNEHH